MLVKRMHDLLLRHRRKPSRAVAILERKIAKKAQELILSPGRIMAGGKLSLRLTIEDWKKHVFIAGGSGMGKSFLLLLLIRQIIDQRRACVEAGQKPKGLFFLDIHSDTAKAALQYCAVCGIDPADVVYLRPGTDVCFDFDLLADVPTSGDPLELVEWVESVADTIIDAYLRNSAAADQDMMKRLKHQMRNLIWVAAIPIDGKHFGLADLMTLTTPEGLAAVLERVGPRLQELVPCVYDELVEVRDTKSAAIRDKWLESTRNLLSGVMGVYTQLIFGQHGEASLEPKKLIQEGKIVLVDLGREPNEGKKKGLSRAQANVIGGLLLSSWIAAARETPEGERNDHFLFIDEAENFIGEDLRVGFAEMRKFRLYFCIAFQDLSCLRKGELDLVERVISICCTWFVFRQQDPKNVEYLGQALKLGSLDMTPLLIESTLPDGYDWIDTQSFSVGASFNSSSSRSESATHTLSRTLTRSTSQSIQDSVSMALSQADSRGRSNSQTVTNGGSIAYGSNWSQGSGSSEGESGGETHARSRQLGLAHTAGDTRTRSQGRSSSSTVVDGITIHPDHYLYSRNAGRSTGETSTEAEGRLSSDSLTRAEGSSEAVTDGWSRQWNRTRSEGGSITSSLSGNSSAGETQSATRTRALALTLGITKGASAGETEGESSGYSIGLSKGHTEGEGVNVGVTFQKTPLPRHRFLVVPNGKTVVAVADQFYGVMNLLAALTERMVLVKVKGMESPFLLEVHDVQDPYLACGQPDRSKAWREHDRDQFLQKVYEAPFYFVPTWDEHRGRVARFLGTGAEPGAPGAELPPAEYEDDEEENPIG